MPIRAFLVFQGGGAKGIVHVGALSAVEDEKLSVQGVAGTSAGAMVAALVAVGYRGTELFDATSGTHILNTLGRNLGFTKAVNFFGWPWRVIKLCRTVAPYFIPLAFVTVLLAFFGLSWLDHHRPILAKGVGVLLCLAAGVAISRLMKGITTVERVRDFIEHALAHKLRPRLEAMNLYDPNGVTFEHLAKSGGLPLSIVATNVSDKCGEVFSSERTPHVRVADAAAASICLPGVFRPWKFACTRRSGIDADTCDRRFLDGGFISNLPVWTLDAQRKQVAHSVTLAFGIVPAKPSGPRSREGHWLGAIGSSVIAGTMELDMRGVENVHHLPIACDLGLLDFDASLSDLSKAVTRSRIAVRDKLRQNLVIYPAVLGQASSDIQEEVMDLLTGAPQIWHIPASFDVKVALVVQPRGMYGTLATPYNCGFTTPPVTDPSASIAWQTGTPTITLVPGGGDWSGPFWRMTVPYSLRKDGVLPKVEGRSERPLVIVIEFSLAFQNGISPSSPGFATFLSGLLKTVLTYTHKSGLYEAVQWSTSTPWH